MSQSVSKRIIRVPNQGNPHAQQVISEVVSKLQSLKISGSAIYVTYGSTLLNVHFSQPDVIQLEANLTSANDTTLQGSFAGWATILGVAALDTEVATFTAG